MKRSRRKFSASFKAKWPIEALKEHSSLARASRQIRTTSYQISSWKKGSFWKMQIWPSVQTRKKEDPIRDAGPLLINKIGQLQVEERFFKKAFWQMSTTERKTRRW